MSEFLIETLSAFILAMVCIMLPIIAYAHAMISSKGWTLRIIITAAFSCYIFAMWIVLREFYV